MPLGMPGLPAAASDVHSKSIIIAMDLVPQVCALGTLTKLARAGTMLTPGALSRAQAGPPAPALRLPAWGWAAGTSNFPLNRRKRASGGMSLSGLLAEHSSITSRLQRLIKAQNLLDKDVQEAGGVLSARLIPCLTTS